jgi:hypothetical protein
LKFRLACPNGQWVAGKPAAIEAIARLSGIGMKFENVNRHGVEFVRCVDVIEIDVNSIEELVELADVTKMTVTLDNGALLLGVG